MIVGRKTGKELKATLAQKNIAFVSRIRYYRVYYERDLQQ